MVETLIFHHYRNRCRKVYFGSPYLLKWTALCIVASGWRLYVIHVYSIYGWPSWRFQWITYYKWKCSCVNWHLGCCELDVNDMQVYVKKQKWKFSLWLILMIFSVIVFWDSEWSEICLPWFCSLDTVVQGQFHA